jgi:hypothetical protein
MSLLREYIQTVLLEAPRYKPYAWTPWSAEAQSLDYRPARAGVGPGEDRLAVELNGTVQGGTTPYDIVDDKGNKWEVKEPTAGWMVRVGTEGRTAVAQTRAAFDRVNRKLVDGMSRITKEGLSLSDILSDDALTFISRYVEKDVPMIAKGEISKGRLARMHQVMSIVHELIKDEKPEPLQKSVEMGDEDHKVNATIDLKTYIKLGSILKISRDELQVDDGAVLAAAFTDRIFQTDPDEFMKKYWYDAIKASDVFGHTSGVVFVNPAGYKVIPIANIDKELSFQLITQAVPQFKVTREAR